MFEYPSSCLKALGVLLVTCATLSVPIRSQAAWSGFEDQATQLQTDTFSFTGSNTEAGDSNENYYDGDFGDFDGDGRLDRAVISRYGLLWNAGGGLMVPIANTISGSTYQFGDKDNIGNDAVQWADVDGDGDLDSIQGGNGEPLTLQINQGGRFSIKWKKSSTAKRICKIDIERDGDVDLIVAGAFCLTRDCGQPDGFKLWVNDGSGNFTDETVARGLDYGTGLIAGVRAGDIDGDGDFDLVLASGSVMQLLALFNDGDGNFTEQPFYDIPASVAGMSTMGAGLGMDGNGNTDLGDIDGDGDLDYLISSLGQMGGHDQVYYGLFVNDGSGVFQEVAGSRFDVGSYMGVLFSPRVKLADLDHDGDLDIAAYMQGNSVETFGLQGGNNLHIFLNDGTGSFSFTTVGIPSIPQPIAGGINAFDVADFSGDGSIDLWVGNQGAVVHPLVNTYVDPAGIPADMPRNLSALATASGVELTWQAPDFASTVRYYRVYRMLTPGLPIRDRLLIKTIALSAHADESLVAPITNATTTAYLNEADVTLDGASSAIRFTDASAVPGVVYYYSVVHVGNETKASEPAPEVAATVPYSSGTDTMAPELSILSPSSQDGSVFPRVVLQYGDDDSGIDLSSLSVSFDVALGNPATTGRDPDESVADLFQHRDGTVFISAFGPLFYLPSATLVTLSASIADMQGNVAAQQVQFFTGDLPSQLPVADLSPSTTSGSAPLPVDFDGSASSDTDGKLVRWEWYFGDGSTGIGRSVQHTYAFGGSYVVTLVVRDNQGGVGTTTSTISVTGGAPQCTNGVMRSCYTGPLGTEGVGVCVGGTQTCILGSWGACQGESTPSAELCDGLNNDCDEEIDEDWPTLGTSCSAGLGICQASGGVVCASDQMGVVCDAVAGVAGTEICDGTADEDCDGTIDNGCPCVSNETRSCYGGPAGTQGIGLCVAGVQTCSSGSWGACVDDVQPVAEICGDGLDNDCDGFGDAADSECESAGTTPRSLAPDVRSSGCGAVPPTVLSMLLLVVGCVRRRTKWRSRFVGCVRNPVRHLRPKGR